MSVTTLSRNLKSENGVQSELSFVAAIVFLLFNSLLIAPRVIALALFASSQLCWGFYIQYPVLFVVLWFVCFLQFVYKEDEPLHEPLGEIPGLVSIWYWSWHNIGEETRLIATLYYI